MLAPPTGTVTFLLTDVEGSTKWWEEHPLAMQAALRIHDDILRRQADRHSGFVFATGGDAFAVAFGTAHQAIDAAVDAQRQLTEQAWPSPVVLRVRMALHSGESVERDGNYFGPPLNRAARLMSLARGGQILCSEVTARLVGDRVTMRDLGLVSLKDLRQPEHVYQPVLEGLLVEFPPLPTVDAVHHNLPTQLTPLIGRDGEVKRVIELLASHRLVTLTGVGGCGKTRLALAVAADLANGLAGGVFFVELAPVSDPARVSEVIADTVGLSLVGGIERTTVARFLAGKDVLLVLDNCEHLLDEVAAFVEDLLDAAPKGRILVTSREALEVPGEQSHRLPSLDEKSSLALLVERATEASDSFRLDPDDEARAAELCRQLDGIPLALELAAAHLVHLSPAELLQRLDDRFQLLVGGARRHRQRQQTLQTVMEWSWDLLDEDERRVLASLSVFVGGWTLDAAEGVAGRLASAPVAASLRSLASKSLIEPQRTASGLRYRMLETVRLFGQHKLVEMGMAEPVRLAHRDWFVHWVETTPLEQRLWWLPWIHRCADELDNLASAFEWSLDHDELTQAVTLLVSTAGAMHMLIGNERGYRWAPALLARELDERDRVAVLTAGVAAAIGVGDHRQMDEWGAQAEELIDWAEPALACFLLQWRATLAIIRDPERAAALYEAAEDAALQTGSELAIGYIAAWRLHAELCTPQGRLARPTWTPSAYGGPESLGWSCAATTGILQEARLGNLAAAEALLESSSSEYDHPLDTVGSHAVCQALAGEPERAIAEARAVLDRARQRSDVDWHPEMALTIGIAHFRSGDAEKAFTYLEALRRAPLWYPILYDMRRDFAEQARALLDDDVVERARLTARALTVEAILDREVR